jgi:hypothetical protein
MSRVSEALSSLTFTTWTLVVLIAWFASGLLLARSESYSPGFAEMNGSLVREWLLTPDGGSALLKVWFVGLCLAMVLLGVNLVFCSWNRIFRIIRVRFSGPKLVMLIVHFIFGLVALGHFGGFMLGFRHDKVRLQEAQSFRFQDGYDLTVTDIHFVDDHRVLHKTRRELTRNEFHYRANYAEVVLRHNDRELGSDRLYVLRPVRRKGIQVTLKRFTPSRPGNPDPKDAATAAVMLAVSRNPVLGVFLALYPVMIIGTGIYLVMTWRAGGSRRRIKD